MNAVVKTEPAAIPVAVTPMHMLQIAMERGADLAQLEKLMDLQARWEQNEARKAYVAAIANFKADPPTILKSKQVNIPGAAKFAHATLADVVDGVAANLSKYGLSHRWETSQDASGVTVTCILTHALGHSERTSLTAAPDNSGKKNSIQQIASTVTYLERYTLMAATGLAAKDMVEDDGRGAPEPEQRQKPDGYDNWKADIVAVSEEGIVRLQEVWKASSMTFRVYATDSDGSWWSDVKAKAGKVKA